MTVDDLIVLLLQQPGNAEVWIPQPDRTDVYQYAVTAIEPTELLGQPIVFIHTKYTAAIAKRRYKQRTKQSLLRGG